MQEEPTKGHVRNKEKSKQQFLDAVGKIMLTKGFSALKVNDIATTAGLDKKLIYKYFGGKDELIDEYIRSLDFWSNAKRGDAAKEITDGGREFSKQMLAGQFEYVGANEELQRLLLWGLYESRKSLKRVADEREAMGEVVLANVTDPFFKENADTFRAAMAILVSGNYYLNMYAGVNGNTFCGIDVTTDAGREKIRASLELLVDLLYDKLKR